MEVKSQLFCKKLSSQGQVLSSTVPERGRKIYFFEVSGNSNSAEKCKRGTSKNPN